MSEAPDLLRARIVGGREFVFRPITDEDVFAIDGVIFAAPFLAQIPIETVGFQWAIALVAHVSVHPHIRHRIPAAGREPDTVYVEELSWEERSSLVAEVLGEALNRRIQKTWKPDAETTADELDLRQELAGMLRDVMGRGLRVPITFSIASSNGSIMSGRYASDDGGEEVLQVEIVAEHRENNGYRTPINALFADDQGGSAVFVIRAGGERQLLH